MTLGRDSVPTRQRGTKVARNGPASDRAGTLAERAADAIRLAVLEGELSPGSRVREEEFARRLGISRVPLREALRRLAGEGLVELRPRRGARISPLRAADAEEIHAINRALGIVLIHAAAGNIGAQAFRRSERALERAACTQNPAEFLRAIWTFSDTLLSAARRPRTLRIVRELRQCVLGHYREFAASADERRAVVERSRQFLAACRTGDAAAMTQAWLSAVEESFDEFRDILALRAPRSVRPFRTGRASGR